LSVVIKNPETETPLLHHGDRLNAGEFFRRYSAMPEVKKAELINGVVYMGSPVRARQHGRPDGVIAAFLVNYSTATEGVDYCLNSTLLLDNSNMPQPDQLLRRFEGGTSMENERGYLVGPPELVAEISASSLEDDIGPRFEIYRQAGVGEYLLWSVEENVIHWWRLRDGAYEALSTDDEGVIRSEVFPGLWLDTRALLTHDRAGVMRTLQLGLASPEHAEFVRALATQSSGEGG
jgi:Uma2 family endonuclease